MNATAPTHDPARATAIGVAAVTGSLVLQNLGSAVAKHVFPLVGADGVTALRIGLAALLLLAIRRPWRRRFNRSHIPWFIAYGAFLGLMNVLIYHAFARIPLGIAVAIEVTGPLAIALLGSRSRSDFLWLAMAVGGLLLLLPIRASAAIDPVGVAFAVGAAICWALYIVVGKRMAGQAGGDTVTWGMCAAALLFVPVESWIAGPALLSPTVLAWGLLIAILSSALPYTLELEALRRLPAHVFSLFLSAAPAMGALAGMVILNERLSAIQWAAILCIMAASAGTAISAARGKGSSDSAAPATTSGDAP